MEPPRRFGRILCVSPAYSPSFGTFEHAYPIMGRVRAFMPPQGLLVIAAFLPKHWQVRFRDENIAAATDADYDWTDAVLASGMHIQRPQIQEIARRARRHGKPSVLGGPSVSAAPWLYPEFDYLHVGELGDATIRLLAALEADPRPRDRQLVLETAERLPLEAFPRPAFELIDATRYFIGNVQFSSGCPYRCEFCDIPALYGRNPRLKRPEQVVAELDALLERGNPGAIYFVDDNFIANRRAARELLPHLVAWQRRRGFPVELACEATLNLAQRPDILALMREAYFTTVFCGIESPEVEALAAIDKRHNATMPILEAVRVLNRYGLEVVSGIILGLDSDTPETADRVLEFIERSGIPMLTINLLQALPRTPLWDRLAAEGRLVDEPGRESNVVFKLPYEEVLGQWRRCIAEAYRPEAVYRRFAHNIVHTFPNRITPPSSGERASWANIRRGLRMMRNVLLRVGVASDYRRIFWGTALPLLRQGRIIDLLHVAIVAHHLICFSREATAGRQNASFYSAIARRRRLAA
jgi:radical SAM superfamily enzyme YgiQ (UPF0313 family)